MPDELDDIDAALAEAEATAGDDLGDIDAELARAERDTALQSGLVFQDRPVDPVTTAGPSIDYDPMARFRESAGVGIPAGAGHLRDAVLGLGRMAEDYALQPIDRMLFGESAQPNHDRINKFYDQQAQLSEDLPQMALRAAGAADTFADADQRLAGIREQAPALPLPFGAQITPEDVSAGAVSLLPTLAAGPTGLGGMMAAAGAQSAGGTYADRVRQGEAGTSEALRDALASGAITAALMRIVPGGTETAIRSLFAGPAGRQTAMRVLKEAGLEATEEGADEFLQALLVDDQTLSQALPRASQATALGGILGAGANVPTAMAAAPDPAAEAAEQQPAPVGTPRPRSPVMPVQTEPLADIDRQLAEAEQEAASAVEPTAETAEPAPPATADQPVVDQAVEPTPVAPQQPQPQPVDPAGAPAEPAAQPEPDAGQQPGPAQDVVEPVPPVPVGDDGAGDRALPASEAPADVGAPVAPAVVEAGETEGPVSGPVVDQPAKGRGARLFEPASGTLGVPRADMPQIKSEHRGALSNYLRSRGVEWAREDAVDPNTLKPTQAEFDPAKVRKAIKRSKDGSEQRAILVSNDGHVVDGHHQWLGALQRGAAIDVVRLDAPIADLLPMVREFPSTSQEGQTLQVGDRVRFRRGKRKGTEATVIERPSDGRAILRTDDGRRIGGKTGVKVDGLSPINARDVTPRDDVSAALRRETVESADATTASDRPSETVQPVREEPAGTEPNDLPPVPEPDRAPEAVPGTAAPAATEGDRAELRQRLPETREADAETVRDLRDTAEPGDAPRGLQPADDGAVVLPEASPETAPDGPDRGRADDPAGGADDGGGVPAVPAQSGEAGGPVPAAGTDAGTTDKITRQAVAEQVRQSERRLSAARIVPLESAHLDRIADGPVFDPLTGMAWLPDSGPSSMIDSAIATIRGRSVPDATVSVQSSIEGRRVDASARQVVNMLGKRIEKLRRLQECLRG